MISAMPARTQAAQWVEAQRVKPFASREPQRDPARLGSSCVLHVFNCSAMALVVRNSVFFKKEFKKGGSELLIFSVMSSHFSPLLVLRYQHKRLCHDELDDNLQQFSWIVQLHPVH